MIREKELDVSMKCVKYMLFVANCMFALVGFLLISIGTTIKSIYTTLDNFLEDHFYGASDLAIAVGFIIFFVSIFGCVGAFRQSVCLINTYALLLMCVLILEIAISITTYALRGYVSNTVRHKMNETMEYYNSFTRGTWDIVQNNLECCGLYGPDDWSIYDSKFHLKKVEDLHRNYTVPKTCCVKEKCSAGNLYKEGCYNKIVMIVSESALLLGIAALCVSFIQVLGIIFAVLLAKSLRKLKTQLLVDRTEAQSRFYEQMTVPDLPEKSPVLYQPTDSEI